MKLLCISALVLAFPVVAAVPAFAGSCTDIYASSNSNGTSTFPGTYVGAAGTGSGDVCQIGNLSVYNGGGGGAFVNSSNNPSIYEFYWGGGTLDITEQIGNNGVGDAIDAELDPLASQNSTSPGAYLASIQIPYSSGPSSAYTLYDSSLSAGYYAIDTYLAVGNVTDPNFQIDISGTPVVAAPGCPNDPGAEQSDSSWHGRAWSGCAVAPEGTRDSSQSVR